MTHNRDGKREESSSRPIEMPAVKTTIVGGRPPGCGKMLGAIPRGIEVLVKKASVDPAFRALLLGRRSKAADEIGLKLAPAEGVMLDHVPQAQLEAIINRTRVDPSRRNAFLGRAAGVMLAALGVSTAVDCTFGSLGSRPVEGNAPAATQPAVGLGSPQATQPTTRPTTIPAPQGIRPDTQPVIVPAGVRPPPPLPQRPEELQPVRGDRIDRPVSATATQGQPANEPTEVAGVRPAPPPPTSRPDASGPATSRPTTTQASQPASQPALSAHEIDALVKQLDDDNYAVREAAQKKLQDQGIAILPALRQALQSDKLSAEVRSRLESIVNMLAATTKPAEPERPEIILIAGIMPVRK